MLPAIVHINAQPPMRPGDGPIALVMVPTRELALQIQTESFTFASSSKLRILTSYGGTRRWEEREKLAQGVEILVATPGRLVDHLKNGGTNLKRCTYLVLDEADRMLQQGNERTLRKIIKMVRPDRQVLMWSATMPPACKRIA